MDPIKECRIRGCGKVLLCKSYGNVWIEEKHLLGMMRWKKRPKEMVRRLLRILVGIQNLKGMCTRGKSSKYNPVPEDINASIECKYNTYSKLRIL